VRLRLWIVWALVFVLAVVGCGSPTSEVDVQHSPLGQHSPLPTATPPPTAASVPTTLLTTAPTPAFTPAPAPSPGQLIVLHSNDNWGETEPCG
jgi:hypothetical protein